MPTTTREFAFSFKAEVNEETKRLSFYVYLQGQIIACYVGKETDGDYFTLKALALISTRFGGRDMWPEIKWREIV